MAGVVASAGAGAGEFHGGARVAAFTRFGGYAEFAIAGARFAVPLPRGIDFPAAAAGVGLTAVQMAKGAGAVVFGSGGSPEKVRFPASFGVDHPIVYRSEDFLAAVRRATGGEGVDVILDSIGGKTIGQDLRVLRPGGAARFPGPRRASSKAARRSARSSCPSGADQEAAAVDPFSVESAATSALPKSRAAPGPLAVRIFPETTTGFSTKIAPPFCISFFDASVA